MASWRARPTSSSNWREALMVAFDLPKFLSAGTVSAARMPRMEITTSSSISVKAGVTGDGWRVTPAFAALRRGKRDE